MNSRDKKMTVQRIKADSELLTTCDKCGSVMITRKIITKNGNTEGTVKFIKVTQCIVCRHWRPCK